MSMPLAFCDMFPGTPTRSFVTTRFGSSEQGQILADMFPERVVRMQQTHSDHVTCYRPVEGPDLAWQLDAGPEETASCASKEGGICVPDTDALWTAEPDTLLLVKTADCLPLFFYHPSGIVGGIHAGRKGLDLGIVSRTFRDVCEAIGDPERYDITLATTKVRAPFWIYYGPSICVRCYQINKDIDLRMDLKSHAVAQVRQALSGYEIRETFSPFCTSCHRHLFFSYRGGDMTERLYSGIMRPGPGGI